jgi:SAM-dependent methyltransferase
MSERAERVLATWRASAPHWERHAPIIRQMFAPITRAMLEDARVAAGERVLDVAGGVGEPACSIASIVGSRGVVVCTDIVEGMVAGARRSARALELSNLHCLCCAGDALPFRDAAFDQVVCRLGAMFFPDPPLALFELARVTKRGGRVTLAVWSDADSNPMFRSVTDVLARHLPLPPEPPDAPGAFRFAKPGELVTIARAAGLPGATERLVRFELEAPHGFDEFWRMRTQTSDTLRDKLAQLPPDRQGAVEEEIRVATRPYFPGGRMRFPAAVIVVSGATDGSTLSAARATRSCPP